MKCPCCGHEDDVDESLKVGVFQCDECKALLLYGLGVPADLALALRDDPKRAALIAGALLSLVMP